MTFNLAFFKVQVNKEQIYSCAEQIWDLLKNLCNPFVVVPAFCLFIIELRDLELKNEINMLADDKPSNEDNPCTLASVLGR